MLLRIDLISNLILLVNLPVFVLIFAAAAVCYLLKWHLAFASFTWKIWQSTSYLISEICSSVIIILSLAMSLLKELVAILLMRLLVLISDCLLLLVEGVKYPRLLRMHE